MGLQCPQCKKSYGTWVKQNTKEPSLGKTILCRLCSEESPFGWETFTKKQMIEFKELLKKIRKND